MGEGPIGLKSKPVESEKETEEEHSKRKVFNSNTETISLCGTGVFVIEDGLWHIHTLPAG